MRPGVFLSHSSGGDRWHVELRACLKAELEKRHYNVFLDEYSLSAGDMWRPSIFLGLTECVGAILLLSPESLRSKWVQTECTILACRRDLHEHFNQAFRLLPVLLPGVSHDDLRLAPTGGRVPFDHLRLTDSQTVRYVEADQHSSPTAEAARIAGAFPEVRVGDDPMMQWRSSLLGWLENVAKAGIDSAAALLDVPETEMLADNRRAMLATALLHQEFRKVAQALWPLFDQGGRPERGLLKKIAPISLSFEAASKVVEALRHEPGQRVVTVNAEDPLTVERLVRRATCCNPKFMVTEFPTGQSLAEAYPEVLRAVAKQCGYPDAWRNPEKLKRKLSGGLGGPFQVVVLLKCGSGGLRGPVLSELLTQLRTEFGSLLFVVATGDTEVQADEFGLDSLLTVEPRFEPEEEEDLMSVFLKLETAFFDEKHGASA